MSMVNSKKVTFCNCKYEATAEHWNQWVLQSTVIALYCVLCKTTLHALQSYIVYYATLQ